MPSSSANSKETFVANNNEIVHERVLSKLDHSDSLKSPLEIRGGDLGKTKSCEI